MAAIEVDSENPEQHQMVDRMTDRVLRQFPDLYPTGVVGGLRRRLITLRLKAERHLKKEKLVSCLCIQLLRDLNNFLLNPFIEL